MHIKRLWVDLWKLYPTPESFPFKDTKLTPPPTPESSPGYDATPPHGMHRTIVTPTPSPQYAPNPSQSDEGTTMKIDTDYQVSSSDEVCELIYLYNNIVKKLPILVCELNIFS